MRLEENGSNVFYAAIEMSLVPIVLADPHQGDCPIVFANGAFSELTGYDRTEIVGRNCRFLQGPATDRAVVTQIRKAILERWHIHVELVNYRKDGSTFWNALFLNPVFDRGGRLVYLFGTQLDVRRRRALEDVLQKSNDLLSVVQSSVAAAAAFPVSAVQAEHLQRAECAIRETVRHQIPLLPERARHRK